MCLTSRNWRIRYFVRSMSPLIPFIQEGIRCTMITRQPIGGTELREMLQSMLLFATHVREWKPSINDLLYCCNPCKYMSESRKRLRWILSWYCLGLNLENDSLWVIVDRLVKVAHFIPVKTTYIRPQLAELYSSRIVYLHEVSKWIVSTRRTQFILKFWDRFPETMDIRLNFSSTYHPQTDGQPRP
jgi:hypothetical protein